MRRLTTCYNLKVIHLRCVINEQNTTMWSVKSDWSYCGFSCDCTITKCILFNNATSMNRLEKTFSSCLAVRVRYSLLLSLFHSSSISCPLSRPRLYESCGHYRACVHSLDDKWFGNYRVCDSHRWKPNCCAKDL